MRTTGNATSARLGGSNGAVGPRVLPVSFILLGLVLLGTTVTMRPRSGLSPAALVVERSEVIARRDRVQKSLNVGGLAFIACGLFVWVRRSKGGAS